jgi:PTH1 family peptidyl-tRNA hydrolase
MVDRLAYDWGFGSFRKEGPALVLSGSQGGHDVVLVKPLTYMNRSGSALLPWLTQEGFDASEDLLVIVDDATREVGKVRFRGDGTPGGHNGLKSIAYTLGSDEYARMRLGVGRPPAGADMADWVLSPMEADDEATVLALLPELTEAVALWVREGVAPAMNRFNR